MLHLNDFKKMKKNKNPIAWITAYDYPLSQCAEYAGIDMILVGDSGGMVQLGYESTNPVTMNEMITMAKSVRRGAPNTFIVGDMPQGSYEISNELAIENALRFVKEAGCNSIKLEGGKRIAERVKAISDAGILVMGHLGLTPQSSESFGGYKVQGKTIKSIEEILKDAKILEENGAFSILLEAMPTISGEIIQNNLNIPIYGIGAGCNVDGQLIIMHDILGFYSNFRPWFAKCYIPEAIRGFDNYIESNKSEIRNIGIKERSDGLLNLITIAIKHYIEDVKSGKFPGEEYSYQITEDQRERIIERFLDDK